jgi:hypothetical protein
VRPYYAGVHVPTHGTIPWYTCTMVLWPWYTYHVATPGTNGTSGTRPYPCPNNNVSNTTMTIEMQALRCHGLFYGRVMVRTRVRTVVYVYPMRTIGTLPMYTRSTYYGTYVRTGPFGTYVPYVRVRTVHVHGIPWSTSFLVAPECLYFSSFFVLLVRGFEIILP